MGVINVISYGRLVSPKCTQPTKDTFLRRLSICQLRYTFAKERELLVIIMITIASINKIRTLFFIVSFHALNNNNSI